MMLKLPLQADPNPDHGPQLAPGRRQPVRVPPSCPSASLSPVHIRFPRAGGPLVEAYASILLPSRGAPTASLQQPSSALRSSKSWGRPRRGSGSGPPRSHTPPWTPGLPATPPGRTARRPPARPGIAPCRPPLPPRPSRRAAPRPRAAPPRRPRRTAYRRQRALPPGLPPGERARPRPLGRNDAPTLTVARAVARGELSDGQWARLAPLLPPQKPVVGRSAKDHRAFPR